MIDFNGISLDGMTIELTTAPPRKASYAFAVKRHTFYRQHELAIWIIVVALLASGVYATMNNANLMWQLSTPVMRLIP